MSDTLQGITAIYQAFQEFVTANFDDIAIYHQKVAGYNEYSLFPVNISLSATEEGVLIQTGWEPEEDDSYWNVTPGEFDVPFYIIPFTYFGNPKQFIAEHFHEKKRKMLAAERLALDKKRQKLQDSLKNLAQQRLESVKYHNASYKSLMESLKDLDYEQQSLVQSIERFELVESEKHSA